METSKYDKYSHDKVLQKRKLEFAVNSHQIVLSIVEQNKISNYL